MSRYYLPGVLSLIAEEVSEDVAVKLAEAKGGRMIYVPAKVKDNSPLAEVLGLEDAQKVAKLLGAGDLLVPCGNIGGAGGRRARIVELHAQGLTHSQIAEQVGVHIRTVERATARVRDKRQPLLPL